MCSVDYVCVLDFEATCEENAEDFPHEIIEVTFHIFKVVDVTVSRRSCGGRFKIDCSSNRWLI